MGNRVAEAELFEWFAFHDPHVCLFWLNLRSAYEFEPLGMLLCVQCDLF